MFAFGCFPNLPSKYIMNYKLVISIFLSFNTVQTFLKVIILYSVFFDIRKTVCQHLEYFNFPKKKTFITAITKL